MEKLKVTYKPVDDIIPYENNPRYNDSAVEAVAESIKQTGYNNPTLDGHSCKQLLVRLQVRLLS